VAALIKRLNSAFLKGLLTLLPIALTISLLIWIVRSLESTVGDVLTSMMPTEFYIPGLGLVLAIIAIIATGLLVENYLAGSLLKRLEESLKRAPVIRAIYSPLKDLTDLFSRAQGPDQAQKVVFVRISPTIELVGLVMRETFNDLPSVRMSQGTVAVFVPFSYGFGGYTLLVQAEAIRDAGIPAERALQLAITGWVRAGR
jgi:uncharacterized membrane protein